MRAKTDESPSIKSKMDDAAEAVAAVTRDLIEGLASLADSAALAWRPFLRSNTSAPCSKIAACQR